VPCFGHVLNLAIKKGTEYGMDALVARCSKLAEYFHRSAKAAYVLEEKQRLLDMPVLKLIQRCETRWNSVHAMVQRIVRMQPALCAALMQIDNATKRHLMPEVEMEGLEQLLTILEPFSELTQEFSSESKVTISQLMPTLHVLKQLLEPLASDLPQIKEIKAAMKGSLEDRYTLDEHKLLLCATFLDPRLKQLPFLSVTEKDAVYALVMEKMISALMLNIPESQTDPAATFGDASFPTPPAQQPVKKSRMEKMLFQLYGN
jgi:hypothetical protein